MGNNFTLFKMSSNDQLRRFPRYIGRRCRPIIASYVCMLTEKIPGSN